MFFDTLYNVLMMFLFLAVGFLLRKINKASEKHLPTLSSILVNIGTPFLQVSAFMSLDFSWDVVKKMATFFGFCLIVQAIFFGILFLCIRKKSDDTKFRITPIGAFVGNVGFLGLPVVKSLFPANPEVMCYSAMFMLSMNILIFTVGIYSITGEKKYVSFKQAFFNPATLGFALGILFFAFDLKSVLPSVFTTGISSVASSTTPLCMFILGIRLACTDLKKLFINLHVYSIVGLKLIVFPLFAYLCVYFLPVDEVFKTCVLVLASTPCAAVLLSLCEMYETETDFAANALLLSQILCVFTMPLLTLLL